MTLRIHNRKQHRRRGSIYVVVLGTSMTVMLIGMSAVMAVRVERRSVSTASDFAIARVYAQSAIEMGFFWMRDDPAWRNTKPSGFWAQDVPMGKGTYSLEVIDPVNGDFQIDPLNVIEITGTGVVREARYQLRVTLQANQGGWVVSPGSWKQIVN